MRAAPYLLTISGLALLAPACHKPPAQDQNIAIDNGAAGPTDIEALPADESSGTSSNELANGNDNADVGDLDVSANSY